MHKTILLTGGAGYIGSHTAVELLNEDYTVIILDNLYNSNQSVIDNIKEITGKKPIFYNADATNSCEVESVFNNHPIDAVIHFAGFKAVGESVAKPVDYYRNNLYTTLTLLEVMARYNCNIFVFSSSATVYGTNGRPPFTEEMPTGGCTNPYGWTKLMIEQILTDTANVNPALSVILLRYFNPIGAHESGLIGERPNGVPNNLMPYIMQVAAGIREKLSIFGTDYPTPDGTGVRDYIHVVDLAKGHLAALEYGNTHTGIECFNLGTGIGYSVFDLVHTFEAVNRVKVPYACTPRRSGDIAICYAGIEKALNILHWKTTKSLEDMCRDSWHWQQMLQG